MPSGNSVVLVGHITRDPEVKSLSGDLKVLELGLAVNNRVKKAGEWVDEPCFIDCTIWGRQAEYVAENSSKGDPVYVQGTLRMNSWEKDGKKVTKHVLSVEKSQLLKGRQG